MKQGFCFIVLISVCHLLNAAVTAITAHSRANCVGFNESVTWHWNHYYYWRVESHHFINNAQPRPQHIIDTGKNYTWRAAAYHATEAYSSRGDAWFVKGFHFYYPKKKEALDVVTTAENCNIYDGWWDH